MNDHRAVSSGRVRRASTRIALAAVLASLLLPGAIAAAGSGALTVRGTQLAYDSSPDCPGGYPMIGDLEGCWYITNFWDQTGHWPKPDSPNHNLRATGTELFVGWIGSQFGSFETEFQYTAKFDGPWTDFIELHGRCHHPIVADTGTGDFVGITGELSFKDVVDVNPPYYPYWGSLRIAGQELALDSAAASSTWRTTGAPSPSC